jgi:hypothetical protein
MNKIIALAGVVAAACLAIAPSISHAQATRTWVSGVGDDANPCSRTAPCKTFAGAISKTATGGEINTLDPGGFGAVTITKSITIGTDPSMGGILGASTNGVTINTTLATDVVTLRGLVISSPTVGALTGLNGVRILNAGVVNIENSFIYGNRAANGAGVTLTNTTGKVLLNISNTLLSENGQGAAGGGIVVAPTGSGGAVVVIDRVTAIDNTRGIRIDASATTGPITASINKSMVANNSLAGISVVSAGTSAQMMVTDTVSSSNNAGVNANGVGAVALINKTTLFGNVTGIQAVSSGQVISYSNNAVNNNGTDGAPSSTTPLK